MAKIIVFVPRQDMIEQFQKIVDRMGKCDDIEI